MRSLLKSKSRKENSSSQQNDVLHALRTMSQVITLIKRNKLVLNQHASTAGASRFLFMFRFVVVFDHVAQVDCF